ncbi:helix-turn-helix domain-containing protein [Streptomyces sp. NPDC041068]|uniref:helix-turn-helix domain-containing protein n=1 Tax=Streptomyces sp. NPDC041068 TaxID=3155130 RepID=UPI0033DB2D1B
MSRPQPGRRLVRANGSVVVPPSVAGEVARILFAHLDARARTDGGELSRAARRLLVELQAAAQHADRTAFDFVTAPFDSAATGSTPALSGTVSVPVAEAAALMECSPRWIRHLITTGRLPAERLGARVWAIDRAALDHYRHHQGDTAP